MKFTIYFSGGSSGAPLARSLLTSQNFLNFMQFFGKFGKLVCWRPLEGRRPSYGESWIPIDSLVFLLLFFFMFGSCFRLVCIRYPFLHRRKSNIHKMKLFTPFFVDFRTDPSKICTWTQFFKVSLLRRLNGGHTRGLRILY